MGTDGGTGTGGEMETGRRGDALWSGSGRGVGIYGCTDEEAGPGAMADAIAVAAVPLPT